MSLYVSVTITTSSFHPVFIESCACPAYVAWKIAGKAAMDRELFDQCRLLPCKPTFIDIWRMLAKHRQVDEVAKNAHMARE